MTKLTYFSKSKKSKTRLFPLNIDPQEKNAQNKVKPVLPLSVEENKKLNNILKKN